MLCQEQAEKRIGEVFRPLTSRQREVLNFIQKKLRRCGVCPSVREIADSLNIQSPSTVLGHLDALEKKGYIRREANQSRSIVLCQKSSVPFSGTLSSRFTISDPARVNNTICSDPESMFYLRADAHLASCSLVSPGDLLLVHPKSQLREKETGIFVDADFQIHVGKGSYDPISGRRLLVTETQRIPWERVRLMGTLVAIIRRINASDKE
ncbi:MAG: hypothetical protein Q4D98_09070 [Planctomycetia bacterium]|nr:hypothetical protein [Planctomycetia bacterium]